MLKRLKARCLKGDIAQYCEGGKLSLFCVVRWTGSVLPSKLQLASGLMWATNKTLVEPYLDAVSFVAEVVVPRRSTVATPEAEVVWLNQPIRWESLTEEAQLAGLLAYAKLPAATLVQAAANSAAVQVLKPGTREEQT